MTQSHRPSRATLYYGGDNFLVPLNPIVDSGYSIVGVGNISRRAILGQRGRTADGVDAGFTAVVNLRYSAAIDNITNNPAGFLVLRRDDAGDCYVIPALLAGINNVNPAAGIITRIANFVQAEGNLPIVATKIADVGEQFAVAANELQYVVKIEGAADIDANTTEMVDASKGPGIYPVSANLTAQTYRLNASSTTAFVATGLPLVAEGS